MAQGVNLNRHQTVQDYFSPLFYYYFYFLMSLFDRSFIHSFIITIHCLHIYKHKTHTALAHVGLALAANDIFTFSISRAQTIFFFIKMRRKKIHIVINMRYEMSVELTIHFLVATRILPIVNIKLKLITFANCFN